LQEGHWVYLRGFPGLAKPEGTCSISEQKSGQGGAHQSRLSARFETEGFAQPSLPPTIPPRPLAKTPVFARLPLWRLCQNGTDDS